MLPCHLQQQQQQAALRIIDVDKTMI